MEFSRDTDTSHDLNLTAGSCKNSTFTDDMILPREMTKQADAAWAAGDDAGGLFTGSTLPTSGMIACWLIKNPTTGDVDWGYDTSFTSPTLPSGYTISRLIGGWVTDASDNFIGGIHKGTSFSWLESTADINDTTITSGAGNAVTAAVTCPPNCIYHCNVRLKMTASVANVDLFARANYVGKTITDGGETGVHMEGAASVQSIAGLQMVTTNSSSQIDYSADFTGATLSYMKVFLNGWIMLTRNNP